MTEHDNSFTADGPNVVAFDNGPNFSFGVKVVGKDTAVVGTWIPGGAGNPLDGCGVRGYGQTGVEGISLWDEIRKGPGAGVVGKGYIGVHGKGQGGAGGRFEAELTYEGDFGAQLELPPGRVTVRQLTTYPAAPEEVGGYRGERNVVIGLPYAGQIGQLLTLVFEPEDTDNPNLPGLGLVTLWLCVDPNGGNTESTQRCSYWRQVLLGSPVTGPVFHR